MCHLVRMEGMVEAEVENTVIAIKGSRTRLLLYLAPLVFCPLLILVFAIVVEPTQWFAEHSGDPFLVTLGYGSQLRNADCKITIYGDSTAMIGINPGIIQKRTGLSTCNIAETEHDNGERNDGAGSVPEEQRASTVHRFFLCSRGPGSPKPARKFVRDYIRSGDVPFSPAEQVDECNCSNGPSRRFLFLGDSWGALGDAQRGVETSSAGDSIIAV